MVLSYCCHIAPVAWRQWVAWMWVNSVFVSGYTYLLTSFLAKIPIRRCVARQSRDFRISDVRECNIGHLSFHSWEFALRSCLYYIHTFNEPGVRNLRLWKNYKYATLILSGDLESLSFVCNPLNDVSNTTISPCDIVSAVLRGLLEVAWAMFCPCLTLP